MNATNNQTNPNGLPFTLEAIKKDRKIRVAVAKNSHLWFFSIYFARYITHPTALFQREMFSITEDENLKMAVIVAFRGSAKSTIMTLSYPIWAVLGVQQKKFVIILSQTQYQARLHLTNLKRELETNELLRGDIGPFEEETDEWGSSSIVIPKYNARITVASTEQSIRGLRHGEHRPDLILCDDVEDLSSVKTREGRNKTFNWLTSEVIPIGDTGTKIILVGNLLHEDSLLMRLKSGFEEKQLDGIFRAYPLLDEQGNIAWPGKFKDMEAIEELRRSIGSEIAWQREFLLRIIADSEQVVHKDWLHYYEELPGNDHTGFLYYATGIDLAISERDTADYSAMVSAKIHGYSQEEQIYILPNPVNERLSFPEQLERVKLLSTTLDPGTRSKLFIEEVGYQAALIQQLEREGYPAEGVKIHGQDKRARLALTTHMIQDGRILFPRQGCEELIRQLTGFGIEKHDDLADAFSILILKIINDSTPQPRMTILTWGRWDDDDDNFFSNEFGNKRITLGQKW